MPVGESRHETGTLKTAPPGDRVWITGRIPGSVPGLRTRPSRSSDRMPPASMSTQRSPPHCDDHTAPSPWWAIASVIRSACTVCPPR